jgi:hypothetical protein
LLDGLADGLADIFHHIYGLERLYLTNSSSGEGWQASRAVLLKTERGPEVDEIGLVQDIRAKCKDKLLVVTWELSHEGKNNEGYKFELGPHYS